MRVQLVRHATLIVEFGGRRLLVDPMLSDVNAMAPVPLAGNDRRIPMVPLPVPVSDVVSGLDAVLVTHLHQDHFDGAAADLLPKHLPVICQPGDQDRLRGFGFTSLSPVDDVIDHEGVEIIRTNGKHGTGLIGRAMGRVSGFVLRAHGEPSLYIAGDTVWCSCVRDALETYEPAVVVVNAGGAQFRVGSPITMTGRDVALVCQTAPDAVVVAVHMDTVNHCLLTRAALHADLTQRGVREQVRIPADGEALAFPA